MYTLIYAYSYFFLFFIKQVTLMISDNSSAIKTDSQIPFIPIIFGNTNITITWNTSVLAKLNKGWYKTIIKGCEEWWCIDIKPTYNIW